MVRMGSPDICSTLMTRAPKSVSMVVPWGAAKSTASSRMVTPAKGRPSAASRGVLGASDRVTVPFDSASSMISPWCSSSIGALRSIRAGVPAAFTRAPGWRMIPRSASSTSATMPSWTSWGCSRATGPLRNCSAKASWSFSKVCSHWASVFFLAASNMWVQKSKRLSASSNSGAPCHRSSANIHSKSRAFIMAMNRCGATEANWSHEPSAVCATSKAKAKGLAGRPCSSKASTGV